jgi:hypothetical protein
MIRYFLYSCLCAMDGSGQNRLMYKIRMHSAARAAWHRAGRVLSFLFNRPNWDSLARECAPSPEPREGGTLACG